MGAELEIEDAGIPDEVAEISVTRDGVLPRYAVDTAIPVYLGRDFEVALLSYTVRLEAEVSGRLAAGGQAKSMRISGEMLEVARIRMPPAGAREMAMGVLRQLVESGHLAGDALKHEISSMVAAPHNDVAGDD